MADKKDSDEEIRTEPKTIGHAIMMDVDTHGEVHMIVDEHGDTEIEARRGQTRYNSTLGLIIIFDGQTHQKIRADSVVRWYTPYEVMH